MNNESKRIAIVPGSFDPITKGHLDIVQRAAVSYDIVYLAIMINPEKKYMFTMDQRKRIAEAVVSSIANVRVITSKGMLWKLAKDLGACAIVKGYRNETDLAYEKEMEKFNREHNPDAKTVLLKSNDALAEISSTAVRSRILERKDLHEFLPQAAIDEIYKIISVKL